MLVVVVAFWAGEALWVDDGWVGFAGGTYVMVWYVRRGFVDGGGEAGLGTWGMLEASLGRRDEGQAVRV